MKNEVLKIWGLKEQARSDFWEKNNLDELDFGQRLKLIENWEKNNSTCQKLAELEKEIAEFEKINKTDLENEEKNKEQEKLEKSKNQFWITTPNYKKMDWGSKEVKLEWVDESDYNFAEKIELNDKVVKIDDNWFKMVKISNSLLPDWLKKVEKVAIFYLPTQKSQAQVAKLQFKTVGSWEVCEELEVVPKFINSSKITWLIENKNHG